MIWTALANLVFGLHILWVLFNIAAPYWAWRIPAIRVMHLICLVSPLVTSWFTGSCPLDALEGWLRSHSETAASSGGFLPDLIRGFMRVNVPSRWIDYAMLIWLAVWGPVYAYRWRLEARP